jgi:hypothetical protein
MRRPKTFLMVLVMSGTLLAEIDNVPAKTNITVRTIENIDAKGPSDNRIYHGVVGHDVTDSMDGS